MSTKNKKSKAIKPNTVFILTRQVFLWKNKNYLRVTILSEEDLENDHTKIVFTGYAMPLTDDDLYGPYSEDDYGDDYAEKHRKWAHGGWARHDGYQEFSDVERYNDCALTRKNFGYGSGMNGDESCDENDDFY